MTTLIIPDIHLNYRAADKIIKSVGADQIIFLGDVWDDFYDTPQMNADTANWLVESVKKENRIHLLGNHCCSYLYHYRQFKCSGYTDLKDTVINAIIDSDTRDKLKFYHVLENNWLITHAGLTRQIIPSKVYNQGLSSVTSWLDKQIEKDFDTIRKGNQPFILGAGAARYGNNQWGGIIWSDFDKEFQPIQGINQIFGHTPQRSVVGMKEEEHSLNYCIDVYGNMHYAIVNGMDVRFGSIKDL